MASVLRLHPFKTSVVLATIKGACCDVLVQRGVERKSELDLRRVAVFASFSMMFTGVWQFVLFVRVMPRLCPAAEAFAAESLRKKITDARGLRALATQLFIENGINNPILYFPCFYTVQAILHGDALTDGLVKYRKHYKEDILAIWRVWIPAQLLNFACSPLWLRVPFTACVSFGWTAYVSFTRGAKHDDEPQLIAAER